MIDARRLTPAGAFVVFSGERRLAGCTFRQLAEKLS
jgi:hypothetical protein